MFYLDSMYKDESLLVPVSYFLVNPRIVVTENRDYLDMCGYRYKIYDSEALTYKLLTFKEFMELDFHNFCGIMFSYFSNEIACIYAVSQILRKIMNVLEFKSTESTHKFVEAVVGDTDLTLVLAGRLPNKRIDLYSGVTKEKIFSYNIFCNFDDFERLILKYNLMNTKPIEFRRRPR